MQNTKTADLEWDEFSAVDADGKFHFIKCPWRDFLMDHLGEHYNATSILEMPPYLVVECPDSIPPPSERPSLIAGLVSVWIVEGHRLPEELPVDPGERGHGQIYGVPWIEMKQDLLDGLKLWVVPKTETLSAIFNTHFKPMGASALSYFNERLVVEFQKTTKRVWLKQLRSLPYAISKSEVPLRYSNGLIPGPGLAPLFGRVAEPEWRPRARAMNRS